MARFGQSFKDRAVARLLPPENATLELVSKEVGITVDTLERWRESLQSMPARGRAWTASAKLQAVITTAALSEVDKNAWCREHGIYPAELEQWCSSAIIALADPQGARSSPQVAIKDRKRIKDLERELMRKDRALAETAALLVLSKKVAAIYHWGEDA